MGKLRTRAAALALCVMLVVPFAGGAALASDDSTTNNSNLTNGNMTDGDNTNPGTDEQGKVEPVIVPSKSDIAAGTYYLQSANVSSRVLDVKGAKVVLGTTAGTKQQRWVMKVGDDGYAMLVNAQTHKVLTVKGKAAKSGAVIYQADEVKVPEKTAGATTGATAGTTTGTTAGATSGTTAGTTTGTTTGTTAGTTPDTQTQTKDVLAQKWVVKKSGKYYSIVSALDETYALSIASAKAKVPYGAELRKAKDLEKQQFTFVKTGKKTVKAGKKTIKNGVYMLALSSKAKQVVSIGGSAKKSGANVVLADFAAKQKQTFKVVYDNKGFYTLTNMYSGKKLAPLAACSVSGVNVAQYGMKATNDRAKWRIERFSTGYRLVNKASGLALQIEDPNRASGSNIYEGNVAKTKTQRFSFVRPCQLSPASANVLGTRYISMAADKSYVVGSRNDSRGEYASATIRWKNGSNLQRLKITKAGKGTYKLRNVMTKRYVTLAKKSKKKGVNVIMRRTTGGNLGKWRVVYNDDFTYAFENVYSGMHLHVSGAKTADNANLKVTSAKTSSAAQKFKVKSTTARTDEVVALDVPCYWQNPELPTGCESVACTNLLRYWGYDLDKEEIASDWMPYGSDGVWNFIGWPWNDSGWIICAPGIANTANNYIDAHGDKNEAEVFKGKSLYSLRKYLDRGEPLVVWTTIGMGYPGQVQWWNSGYPLRSNNHAVVLSGYDPNTGDYLVADSLAGTVWRDGGWFEYLYEEMGSQAVHIYAK